MQPGMTPPARGRASSDSPLIESIHAELQSQLGAKRYAMWCDGKIRLRVEDDQLTVGVGSPFLLNWMQKQFRSVMVEAARTVLGASAHVAFEVDASLSLGTGESRSAQVGPVAIAGLTRKTTAALETTPTKVPDRIAVRNGRSTAESQTAPGHAHGVKSRRLAELNDFIASPGAELALTAARQIAGSQPVRFNPLVLCGACGTGKTHLIEGICKQLRKVQPGLHVILITAEAFANYFTQALRDHTLPAFRQRFRTVDVLLVDDVDFFESKRVFQEEFLHTFAELNDHGRQVVVTSNRHPRLLTKLGDDLVSRFLSGLVCRLDSPDLATREKIVAAKAKRMEGEYAPEALSYVAQRFPTNVRELEGALNCLQTYYSMTGRRVTQTAARQVLADLERDCMRIIRLADVERVICGLFGVKPKDLKSACRARTVSHPRMLAMYLARRLTQSAYSEIGQHFGGRNHSTVMSAERKVQQWLEEQATLRIAAQEWSVGEVLSVLEQQLLAG